MQMLELIKRESVGERRRIILAATVSGVANAFVLGVINAAAQHVEEGLNFRYFLMFLSSMALYIYCLKYTQDRGVALFEGIISKITIRLSHKIKDAELSIMEEIGRALIYNRLTQETEVISDSQQILVNALQSFVVLIFASAYIYTISPASFFLILAMHSGTVMYYLYREKETNHLIQQATAKWVELIEKILYLLDGFKQIKMRKRLGDELTADIEIISNQVYEHKISVARLQNSNNILAASISAMILGAIVFILPRFIPTHHEVISELIASILFIFGPLSYIVIAVPTLEKANIAALNIATLEEQLDKKQKELYLPASVQSGSRFASFRKIELRGIEFSYRGKDGEELFHLGPLNLEIERGKILFIVGGNGTGKSTVLKLLTGLYQMDRGTILIDDVPLGRGDIQEYRELFSIIFADFYLFEKLYGLDPVSRETVLDILKDMELQGKTDYDGERFTNLNLSTGQRKRIALLVAILEKRPIFIFDEWAADQDPHFRKHFYNSILPDLRRQGKTIIAVTHDDHYFEIPNRIVKMDYGIIESDREIEETPPPATP